MKDLEIERVQVYAVGPETERYAWASDMGEQFMTNNIVRITTRGGLEGVGASNSFTEHGYDRSVAETLRPLLPPLIGACPLEREAIWYRLQSHNLPGAPQALSAIDVALWDLTAKHAGLPLYQFLGGARSRIRSYASTPLLRDPQTYIDFVTQLQQEGFRAVKFHAWCDVDRDIEMARAVHARFGGSGLQFMLDVEQRYDRSGAYRAARELEAMGFTWFEAPLLDQDIEGYRDLRRRVNIPILPAGNWILDLTLLYQGIRAEAWSAVRVDTAVVGGITPARKVMALAEAAGMTAELQCWGYTLNQAANLHVMLAYSNCTFFEQPVPYPAFEFGMIDTIRTDAEGYVNAPAGPGLGVRVDWDAMHSAAFLTYEETKSGKKG
ncbi:MAG: mandelate racemase/muconate lactonizing enzyme family protein [Candidatus Rokubacteria bacterium]|nr:mandelate racemase/muconate lactonizing enzyme family protein [Candidatus Rokubacteria bacterium]MBI3454676.1 mandelate racemase/muconate lactonizing enzyme family protein [Candidatus Rokubacteria bacterium]